MKRYRVAFVYRKSNRYMSGSFIDNNMYNFYFKAMKRNPRIDIDYVCDDIVIDLAPLNDKYDALIFMDVTRWGAPDLFLNMNKVKIPKIFLPSDCHHATYVAAGQTKTRLEMCKEYGFDYYYDFQTESYFHKFYPKEFKYKWIPWGIEKGLFEKVGDFNGRISDKILNTGNLNLPWYQLRSKCNELDFVKYESPDPDYIKVIASDHKQDNYVRMLEKYCASIGASNHNVCNKQIEIPAAGCLMFIQVDENDAIQWGFEDMKTAVFINKDNYVDVMKNYLETKDMDKWREIAKNGREFVMNNYTNDILTNGVVTILEELGA